MSQLIVIKFDDMDQAGKVREALRAQEKQGLIKMEDAEVIVCDADGKIEKKGETDRGVKIGAFGGGMLGLLLGLVFFPIGELLLGAAAGALIGKSLGLGVDKKFVKEVSDALTPGPRRSSSSSWTPIRAPSSVRSNPSKAPYSRRPYRPKTKRPCAARCNRSAAGFAGRCDFTRMEELPKSAVPPFHTKARHISN